MNLTFVTHTILLIKYVIDRPVDVNAFIVTGDITSLYTNMDIKCSIDEVAEIFASHPDPKRPDEAILSWILPYGLMISSLQVNIFLQVLGTAIGKRFAPNLVNIYHIKFDKAALSDLIIKPQHYFRFINDTIFIWCGSLRALKEFEVFLNNLIPGIKVTLVIRSQVAELNNGCLTRLF
jgi:hypothetical protein